jgi:hypothetical protein
MNDVYLCSTFDVFAFCREDCTVHWLIRACLTLILKTPGATGKKLRRRYREVRRTAVEKTNKSVDFRSFGGRLGRLADS